MKSPLTLTLSRKSAVEKMFQPSAASVILTASEHSIERLVIFFVVLVSKCKSPSTRLAVLLISNPNMENPEVSCDDELPLSHIVDEEDFRSYCANEQVQKKLDFYAEETVANYLALLYGLTVALQKNLLFVVAVTVSEFLYNQASRSFKWFNYLFCSFVVYMKMALQKSSEEKIEIPILVALRERMFKKTSNFDGFVLKLALLCDLDQALSLAQVAVCDLQILEQMVIVLLVVQVKVDVMDSESFFSK
ncbi:hypothetical protein IGI04_010963 [Brassica rapa subsp. trilocularis]|uniref:Uncharacterized protein n=1 Tax=Brassica rapa subsp. trilocularis TaxID=1813537 RepID=A0ABQ7N1P7_BRACM|nr:hypothetical protein IGI04_010963 [Brassica rapa subsp. trilocularis]